MDIIAYALAKGYTKKAIDDLTKSLGTPIAFKGTVALKTDLPTTGNKIGEIYHVIENKNEYIWMDDNGAQRWEDIGPIMTGVAHINDSVVNENDTWSSKKINDNDIKEISSSIDEEKITTVITKKDNTQITAEVLLASPKKITDDRPVHKKEMPLCAESVKVNSISGKTEKSNNIILFPYANLVIDVPKEVNGITFTANSDGGISIKGTSTAFTVIKIADDVKIGNSFISTSNGNESGTNNVGIISKYLYYNPNSNVINVAVDSGKTVDETIYPMANMGTKLLPYEKGYTGLYNAKVTAIKGTTTTAISPEVLGLPNVGHEWTRIDYINGKYYNANYSKTVSGASDEAWSFDSRYGLFRLTNSPRTVKESTLIYSGKYKPFFPNIESKICFSDSEMGTSDLAEFKAKLASDPVSFEFKTEETITPLVSSAPSVTVSSLGDFELVNEHNIDMPNSIEVATALPTPVSNEQAISQKISLPKNPDGTPDYGAAGQILVSDGTGGITWKDELKVTVTDNPDGTVNLNIS